MTDHYNHGKDMEKAVEDYLYIQLVKEEVARLKKSYPDIGGRKPTRAQAFKASLAENWPYLVAGILVGLFLPILIRLL